MRKLASIQKIVSVTPIVKDGVTAESIECVQVLGWTLVAKKGEFKVGDLCVYFEIDSLLPTDDERYRFLSEQKIKNIDGTETVKKVSVKLVENKEYVLLKTAKKFGQLSQGLALPLSSFPEITKATEDSEVTELLKVIKYEGDNSDDVEEKPKDYGFTYNLLGKVHDKVPMPKFLRNKIGEARKNIKAKKKGFSGSFPSFIPKTDEDRIQNCYSKLLNRSDIKDLEFEGTYKADGSSGTFFLKDGEYGVCSRNTRKKHIASSIKIKRFKWLPEWAQKCEVKTVKETSCHFCKVSVEYDIEKKLRKLNRNLAIQGEVLGGKIQGNHESIPTGYAFWVFRIYDIDKQRYLLPNERNALIEQLNEGETVKLQQVPVINASCKVFSEFKSLDEILKYSEGKTVNNPKIPREGVVWKSHTISELSFKAINNDYLLKKAKKEE